jgi:hypothetical protein
MQEIRDIITTNTNVRDTAPVVLKAVMDYYNDLPFVKKTKAQAALATAQTDYAAAQAATAAARLALK